MRIAKDSRAAFRDLVMYGQSYQFMPCVTNGPDKPQHIFAGRNDMETTMRTTKIDRFAAENRPDQPRITQEQLEAWLYGGIGGTVAKQIEELLNGVRYDITDFSSSIIPVAEPEPPKPTFLPIERPVRRYDVEAGDVLLYCGGGNTGNADGQLVVGQEYTVESTDCGNIYLDLPTWNRATGVIHYFSGRDFSFVRRPGYAKVRDGYVKNGDTVWWLGCFGPERGVVGDSTWEASNRDNLEYGPWCYQKAEPKLIAEHGNPPTARYTYLSSDYATKRNDHDGQPL